MNTTTSTNDITPDLYELIANNNPLIAHTEIEYTHQYNYEVEDNCGIRQYTSEYWERRYLAELNSSMRLDNRIFAQRFKYYRKTHTTSKRNFTGRSIK